MTIDLRGFQAYGHINPGAEDDVCQLCLGAAEENLAGQGVQPAPESYLYILAVYMLALHYFDNRGMLADKTAELPMGVMALVNQMHYKPREVTDGV